MNIDQISARVAALTPSQTLAMSQKSNELRAQGIDVINLSLGEPDFNTPDHIKAAAVRAIDDNFTHYSPVPGYLSLRQAICDKLRTENSLSFTPEQIIVGNGAKHALANVILATVNPGDEVIIPTPSWVSYTELVKLAGGTSVTIPTGIEADFKITPEALAGAITPRTRALLLCSPSNPTGSVYTRDELNAIAEVLAKHPDILLISDEIYEHIIYDATFTSPATIPALAHRTAIINGVSKAYAMTGWRIGYVAAPLWLAKAINKLQGQMTSGVSSIAQKAAEAAYRGSQDCVAEMRNAFRRRRDLITDLARQIPGFNVNTPQGAFYLFPKVTEILGKKYCPADASEPRNIDTSAQLAMFLLDVAHVATVDGAAFGAPGYIRFSYAAADNLITEAMKRVADAVALLK